jgi:hypothetical protein
MVFFASLLLTERFNISAYYVLDCCPADLNAKGCGTNAYWIALEKRVLTHV